MTGLGLEDDPLYVPGGDQIQSWYQPAKTKIQEMIAAGAPPEAFQRFREVNGDTLAQMKAGFGWWFKSIDEEIRKGEARR